MNEIKTKILENLKRLSKKKVNENDEIKSLEIDSLDLAELIIDAEDEFGISISDEEILNIKFVSDITNLITSKIQNK
ncbi:phosphopantetheine-binding protein [Mycoplasma sp. 6243]|uniref:phosphopantetheine-binding protein n=1 Tax=Mycoplasma sp. 6243 TaxID=3440865 RepID=UPI003EB7434C